MWLTLVSFILSGSNTLALIFRKTQLSRRTWLYSSSCRFSSTQFSSMQYDSILRQIFKYISHIMAQQDAHIHCDWLEYRSDTFKTHRAGPKAARRSHYVLLF